MALDRQQLAAQGTPVLSAGYAELQAYLSEARPEGRAADRGWAEHHLAAARVSATLALRTRDDAWLARGRHHFDEAISTLRQHSSGADSTVAVCAAMVEKARFEARDCGDAVRTAAVLETAKGYCGDRAEQDTEWFRAFAGLLQVEPSAAPPVTIRPDERREVTAVHLSNSGPQAVRLTLALTRPTDFSIEEASRGRTKHVTVRLAQTSAVGAAVNNQEVGRGGLQRYALDNLAPEAAALKLVLEPEAAHQMYFLADPLRLVVDVFLPRSAAETSGDPVRVVVLDPGHGGEDFGAESGGLRESVLTLDLAQRTATQLEAFLPDSRILLTRRNNRAISLEERVAFANEVEADVFVSIHLNGWEEQLETGGVTTFVLDSTDDQAALKLAARENGSSVGQVSSMQHLLADLVRGRQAPESRRLAATVHRSLLAAGRQRLPRLPDRGVRSAMFFVLVGARMPAILVEASFLTQDNEREALETTAYRELLAAGIARGVVEYAQGKEGTGGL